MLCQYCKKHKKCKKLCKEFNQWWERKRAKEGYSARWIRHKEIPTLNLEWLAIKRAFRLKYGRKYIRII
jgi:hypothetical protein